MSAPRLLYTVTHPVTAKLLLRGQLAFLRANGFHVTVVSSPGPELELVREREGVETIAVPMSRELELGAGPKALAGLGAAIARARPDIVNASTPKAGVLGMVAARALRVRHRVYLLRGLRLESATGALRAGLGLAERLASACAHDVVCVSESLRRRYVDDGFARARKTSVLASNGIDAARFAPTDENRARGLDVRRRLGIDADALVVGFVGRLVADKGVADLVAAVEHAAARVPLKLLVVGGDLAGDALAPDLRARLEASRRVVLAGKVEDTAPYYAAMDLLLFPSHREGLPNVPLEAAACAIPAVAYRSTGVVDAIEDGVTGRLVDRDDRTGLGDAVARYALDATMRRDHGLAARARVEARYTQQAVWNAWLRFYEAKLRAA